MTIPESDARPAHRRRRRLALWLLGLPGAVLVVAGTVVIVAIRLPLPNRSGHERLTGLTAQARVLFDTRGIPHVRAASEEDAYRVLGWLHAGDRMFQMELRRRAAHGRLAEIFGPSLLAFDIDSRRAGHARAAARDVQSLPPRAHALLDAYAEGVNAYLASNARPVEMVVLGLVPERWSATDTLAFSRFMLTGLSEAPERKVRTLPTLLESTDGTSVLPGKESSTGGGSNAWAISGQRSASGKPILANDPHLGPELPGVWYAAHLTTEDGIDVAGLTLPGIPGVIIGHNGSLAWGITMAQVDDADLYFESVDPVHRSYLREAEWLPLESRTERIRIKGQDDREVTFYSTYHGTLVGGAQGKAGTRLAVALAFAPDRAGSSVEAFELAARARDSLSFEAAWALYRGPAFNVCWASADGRIGVRVAGSIPARRSAIAPGYGSVEDWTGLVPDRELPRLVDPTEGFVASANDDWGAAGHELPYPGFFASRDRVDRIRELLGATRDARSSEMNAMQNDVLSPYALRIVKALSGMRLRGDEARRALSILEAWDGRASRTGPSRLFYAFLPELASRTRIQGWAPLERAIRDPEAAVETHEDVIAAALAAALERVEREDGSSPESWNWGRAHTLPYEHPFSSQLPSTLRFLRRWLDVGPIEMPGEIHTLNVQGFRLGAKPRIRHIPSARLVVDLGNIDDSTLVLPLGQSGQFQDAHYDDQVRAWAEGRTFPFPFTRQAAEAGAASVLRLDP